MEVVSAPKVDATIVLDEASRKLCAKTCDYFVAFSSVSYGLGDLDQFNYGFANSSMERVCEQRRRDGLHGLAVQWGAIGDVGVVTETMSTSHDINIGGTCPHRIPSCLATLDKFLNSPYSVCSSIVEADKKTGSSSGGKQDLLKAACSITLIVLLQHTIGATPLLPQSRCPSVLTALQIDQSRDEQLSLISYAILFAQ